jgi:stage V sporulation protein SpoVS
MKLKKEYLILILIIIALSVYLYMRSADRTLYELPQIPQVNEKDITKLEITKGKTVIRLSKKDEKWYIAPAEYPSDSNKIKAMLDAIKNFELTALVSESKNYNRYDLDNDQKINVKALQGDDLKLDVDVGKTASSFRHTFVRPSGDERVFHAQGNLKNAFDVSVDTLRDKSVLSLKPTDIQRVNIKKAQQSLALTRTQLPVEVKAPQSEEKTAAATAAPKQGWQADNGQAVNESAVNQLLNALANLRCEKFIDDRKKDDFTSPLFTIDLKGDQDYHLSIFAKTEDGDDNYPVVSSGSDYPFQLATHQVNRIMKEPSELLQKPEPESEITEPEKTESKITEPEKSDPE